MIRKACDKCRRTIQAADDQAGARVACPDCGDINVLPTRTPGVVDRASEMGLPSDSGPEVRVKVVRASMLGTRPALFLFLWLVVIAGPIAAIALLATGGAPLAAGVGAAWLAGAVVLASWKVLTYAEHLEITNKRTLHRRGLLSRSVSEVAHDTIRNVQIRQTLWNRVWRVGRLGISSAGQDGLEIEMDGVPRPDQIRRIIDAYRPI